MIKGIIETIKGRMYCHRVGGYVVVEYPSTCKLKSKPFRVYEHMPFLIDRFELINGDIIAYGSNGTELKRWNESYILEVL